MKYDNLYDKIMSTVSEFPENYTILEEQVPVELQREYFSVARAVRKDSEMLSIDVAKSKLYDQESSLTVKRKMLALLASSEKIEALRIIERYKAIAEVDLEEWTILAYYEGKTRIESMLLEERPVFITSGLGGKGQKLRYFTALFSREGSDFSEVQKKLLQNEAEYSLGQNEAELEQIEFHDGYVGFLSVIPLKAPLKNMFKHVIEECNQYGNFLREDLLITNVKKFSEEEVNQVLEEKIKGETNEAND